MDEKRDCKHDQAALDAAVAAERQRIRALVEAVRDANMESQDADDCLIYTPAVQRAWEALMAGLGASAMDENRDCKHGQLARSCDRCADAAEIAELRDEVAQLRRWKSTNAPRLAALVEEMDPRIGTVYTDRHGKEWRFAGLLHVDDDYYYCLTRKGKAQFLSCAGSIECYHFMSQDRETVSVHAIRALAVEAIREATGCPDIKGNDGEYLVDKMERLAMLAARGA